MAKQMRFILSIDGGGIRGLVQARLLMALSEALARRGDHRPLHEIFDLMAGTSTGGILAAGLAMPHPIDKGRAAAKPSELANLYRDEAKHIFSKGVWPRLLPFGGLFRPLYDPGPFEALLQDKLGREACLKDALTAVVLTAYDIQNRHTRFMGSTPSRDGAASDIYLAWQAVRATSAAPTYFPPMLVDKLGQDGVQRQESLVDGGLFANDPTLAAIVEARKMGWDLTDLCVISIGAGQSTERLDHSRARHWGQLGWIKPSNGVPILSSFMQAQAEATAYQAAHLLDRSGMAKGPLTYYRFDAPLEGISDALDDVRPRHLAALDGFADRWIAQQQSQIDAVADLLQPAFV